MADKFHERFKIPVGLELARERFVNRVHNKVFFSFYYSLRHEREEIVTQVLTILGIKKDLRQSWGLDKYVGEDFLMNVQALEALFHVVGSFKHVLGSSTKEVLARQIAEIMELSEVDLGIRWEKDRFLPAGSPLLDERLINDVLGCLSPPTFKGVLTPFTKGLEHFLRSMNKPELLPDVVTDMYEAVEALAKIVTGRDKDLSSNAEAFISKVKLSDGYKPMLKEYIAYANDIRHAGKKGQPKPSLPRKEVEGFVYQTGIFIRLAVVSESQV